LAIKGIPYELTDGRNEQTFETWWP